MYTLLSDVHGDIGKVITAYQHLAPEDTLIQIGDLGFGDTYTRLFPRLDPERFKVISGNHDNILELKKYPHDLGDFGILPHPTKKIAFCRGGLSIDRFTLPRIEGVSWWPEEELDFHRMDDFLSFYEEEKPDIMITHSCPTKALYYCVSNVFSNSRTEQALSFAHETYEPELWIHGHMHVSKKYKIGRTQFIALNINEKYRIE